MNGVFTREERAVVLFLTVSLLVGTVIAGANRVFPSFVPRFDGTAGPTAGEEPQMPAEVWPVDVNTAGVGDLVRLPGIGPARALAIVRLREERGGYRSLEELIDVRGIGPVTLAKLRDKATVGGRATGEADTAAAVDDP